MPLQDSSWGDMKIETQEQLEERMSRPSEADIAAMREMEGDILILGVGGKMGPTLAQLIRRSADLRDQREHRVGQLDATFGGQRDVGGERRRARGPVDQRHPLLRR